MRWTWSYYTRGWEEALEQRAGESEVVDANQAPYIPQAMMQCPFLENDLAHQREPMAGEATTK